MASKLELEEYCRRDAEVAQQTERELSRFCFWESPEWIINNPDRVRLEDDGRQTFLK